jgi:predicted nucleotidyltransferase
VSRRSKQAKRSTGKTSRGYRGKKSSRRSKPSAGSGSVRLQRDWREFLNALISTGTRFLLVGGHAVAFLGEPRLTEDLDVFVEASPANAERLRQALELFGFGSLAPAVKQLATPNRIFMLGRKPWRIDVLTGISGVDFRRAWRRRREVDFEGIRLPVIGLEDLLANKRASGRLKDLADVEALERLARPGRRPSRKPSKRS